MADNIDGAPEKILELAHTLALLTASENNYKCSHYHKNTLTPIILYKENKIIN